MAEQRIEIHKFEQCPEGGCEGLCSVCHLNEDCPIHEPVAPEAEPRKEHALDSDEANHRRQEPLYKLLVRLDEFLHRAAENRELRDEASVLHGEVHDAAFTCVTEARRGQLNDDQIKYMADRFLGWRLPENFSPDAGISFTAKYTSGGYPMKHEPSGTNLFDADQAEEMVRYMIDGMPNDAAEPRKTEPDSEMDGMPDCRHCSHPARSHDDEFGNCFHLPNRFGHEHQFDGCDCPGYEEPPAVPPAVPP